MKIGEAYLYTVNDSAYAMVMATSEKMAEKIILQSYPNVRLDKIIDLDPMELGTFIVFPQGKYMNMEG